MFVVRDPSPETSGIVGSVVDLDGVVADLLCDDTVRFLRPVSRDEVYRVFRELIMTLHIDWKLFMKNAAFFTEAPQKVEPGMIEVVRHPCPHCGRK